MNNHKIYIIVATDKNNGIGKDGKMPWSFKKEAKFFKQTTSQTKDKDKQNIVIMGRTTWESIPEKFRPLKNRINIILTHQKDYKVEGAVICNSIDEAFDKADNKVETIFIIGGARIYKENINNPKLAGIYITKIDKEYECDAFFPQIQETFSSIKSLGKEEENGIEFEYLLYEKGV
jgi:dihydrofolate reductase